MENQNGPQINICQLDNVEGAFFVINKGEYKLSGSELLSAIALYLNTKAEIEEDNKRYKIIDRTGIKLPSYGLRNYENTKKLVDNLNKNGEYAPYTMEEDNGK